MILRIVTAALRDDRGQDLIEYALLAALVSLSATAAIVAVGLAVNGFYQNIAAQLP